MSDYNDQPLHRLEPAYLQHYGLQEPPFTAVADERFYFSTPESSQRLSLLVHMTQYSDMVLMVFGEAGMGKSTLLQNYIKSAHDNWHICRLNANNMMDKDQLLFRIAEDFGLKSLPADSAELQEMLYDKLTQLHQNDVLPVIIVDDAHELAVETLSQLFIMAEIKAGDVTMVHVVLFAEPQIDKTINSSNVSKIRDRIGHYFELTPFTENETADYIVSRLTVAGLQGENPFSAKAIRQIHKQSQGNPARINELAHIALDEAPVGNEPEYDEADEFDQESVGLFTPMRIFILLAVALLAGLGLWQQDRINHFFAGSGDKPAPATAEVTQQARQEARNETPFARPEQNPTAPETGTQDNPAPIAEGPPTAPGKTDTANLDRIEVPAIAEQLDLSNEPLNSAEIERIEPATLMAGNNRQILSLYGKHFTPETEITVSWTGHTKQLPKSRIKVDSDKKIRIELTTGKTPDTWQVSVGNPGQGESSTATFKVTAAKPATLTAAQWVASQPANNVTLQLLGSHSLKPIHQYVKQHKLSGKTVIYKTTHANKTWYILLYGSFSNPQQAQQTIEQLPQAAKTNKPWVRRFASIRGRPQPALPKSPVVKSGQNKVPLLNNMAARHAWLWSQDPSHYTLQLLGTQNLNNIKQFIKQYRLRGKVVYYRTRRDNRDWYALLYGVYPNNKDARLAMTKLPAPIKRLSPWVRKISAIHAEMDKSR